MDGSGYSDMARALKRVRVCFCLQFGNSRARFQSTRGVLKSRYNGFSAAVVSKFDHDIDVTSDFVKNSILT
jgi:hypothetical protein